MRLEMEQKFKIFKDSRLNAIAHDFMNFIAELI
jgi:hypothetical protein